MIDRIVGEGLVVLKKRFKTQGVAPRRNYRAGEAVDDSKGYQYDGRSENCVSEVVEVSGIYGDGDCDAGAGNRRERCGVQRAECGGAAAGEAAECAESLQGAALPVSFAFLSRLPGYAGPEPDVREHGDGPDYGPGGSGYRGQSVDGVALPGEWKLFRCIGNSALPGSLLSRQR